MSLGQHSATVLECDYKTYDDSHWGMRYTCIAKSFRTTLNDRTVTEVKGNHNSGRGNSDVRRLFIKKQSCSYLPLNLAAHFPNLEILYVMNSNVQFLYDGDLDGLTNLKVLDVSHNPIEQLGKDFFKGHSSIEQLSFYDCHLKIIDAEALNPLTNLKFAAFDNNICFDFRGEDASRIRRLKIEIRENCQRVGNVDVFNRHEESQKCLGMEDELSHTKIIAYVSISILVVLLAVLIVALVQIFRNTFRNNWRELKSNLI